MKIKFTDLGRCLICCKNPCECKKEGEVMECAVNKCKDEAIKKMVKPCNGFELSFMVCEIHAGKIASKERDINTYETITDEEHIKALTKECDELRDMLKGKVPNKFENLNRAGTWENDKLFLQRQKKHLVTQRDLYKKALRRALVKDSDACARLKCNTHIPCGSEECIQLHLDQAKETTK